jgi:hypothetical protein
LDATADARLLLRKSGSRSGQIAQVANKQRWKVAAAQEAMLEQLCNLLTALHIGFATGDRLDMLRIRKDHLKVFFKYIPDKLPINSSRCTAKSL